MIQAAPPQWWEILSAFSPLAVLLSAAIAGFFAWRSLRQSAATHAVDARAAADRYAADATAAADRHAKDALAAIERQAAESLAAAERQAQTLGAAAAAQAENALAALRTQWWVRVQWALESTFSSDPTRQKAGTDMLAVFIGEERIPKIDIAALDAAWKRPMARRALRLGIDTPERPADNNEVDDINGDANKDG